MRLLLDTHIWLWSLLEPSKLAPRVRTALQDERNELWLSPLSTWELLLLIEKGRVQVDQPVDAWLAAVHARVPAKEAPLTHEIAIESRRLRLPHQDPVDRFLAATAKLLNLTLVTADERLMRSDGYEVLPSR